MPVKNLTHDDSGAPLMRVPIKHKVSLGLPRGFVARPGDSPLVAPKKLYYFLLQSRDKNTGEWIPDDELRKRVSPNSEEPAELKIKLVGNKIEDMVKADLYYWSENKGLVCSCGTVEGHLKKWCNDRNIAWEQPLSGVKTESELSHLIETGQVDKQLSEYLEGAQRLVDTYKKSARNENYDVSVSEVITSASATRLVKGVFKPFPCLFRKCPDFVNGQCSLNGRFFFVLDGDDVGDISMLVTTSAKNVKNIQWGLENIAQKVVKDRYPLHGIEMRLVGTVEKGSYMGPDGLRSTKFFLVSLKGPSNNMVESGRRILEKAKEISNYYPGGVEVKFDEGEIEQVAHERISEFRDPSDHAAPVSGGDDPPESPVTKIDVKEDKPKAKKSGKNKNKTELLSVIEEAKKNEKELSGEIEKAVLIVGDILDSLPESNGVLQYYNAMKKSIADGSITVERIQKSLDYLKDLGAATKTLNKIKTIGGTNE